MPLTTPQNILGDYNDGLTGVTSLDSYGAYFDISLIPNAQNLGFIIHNISTGVKGSWGRICS